MIPVVPPIVILDWDDTVVLTTNRRRTLLVETIREFEPITNESAAVSAWGAPFAELVHAIAPGLSMERLLPRYLKAMTANPPMLTRGAAEFLRFLRQHNSHTIIFTSSTRTLVEHDARMLAIINLIDDIWSSDENSFSKPDPRALSNFLSAELTSSVRLSDFCYIGDSLSDYAVADGVGVQFMGVTTGATTREDFLRHGVPDERVWDSLRDLHVTWLN